MSAFAQRLREGVGHILGIGYDAGETSRFRRDMGWGRLTPRDEDSYVSPDRTREWIRLKGADLRRNNATVAGLCERLETFFVGTGVRPQARTSNAEWNREAEQFFATWALSCDYRQALSFYDFQAVAVGSRPTQGGLYFELLDNGQVRPIECERIRQPSNKDAAKGFVDGVKYDRTTGIALGYWVHDRDENGGFDGPHGERYIAREYIIPVTRRPWRIDMRREIPDLAPIIPILTDFHEMDTYVRNTAKVRSQIVGFMKKVNGQGANSQPRSQGQQAVGQRDSWRMDWGQMYNMFPNEDVVFPALNIPDPNTIPFMKMELLLASSAMNLPYEFFTMDFSSLDFSRQKGVMLIVNTVRNTWIKSWLNPRMNQRLWNWRIAKAIKDGVLPAAPVDQRGVSEWWKVEWQGDQELNLDRQNANQSDIIEWQMGLEPLSAAASRRGRDLQDTLLEKARILKMAAEIEKQNGLPPGCLINAQIPGQAEQKAIGKAEGAKETAA